VYKPYFDPGKSLDKTLVSAKDIPAFTGRMQRRTYHISLPSLGQAGFQGSESLTSVTA
jgi:hypothetical protein